MQQLTHGRPQLLGPPGSAAAALLASLPPLYSTGVGFPESLDDHPLAEDGSGGFRGERPVGFSWMIQNADGIAERLLRGRSADGEAPCASL